MNTHKEILTSYNGNGQKVLTTNKKNIKIQSEPVKTQVKMITLYPLPFEITDTHVKQIIAKINGGHLNRWSGEDRRAPKINNSYLHIYINQLNQSILPSRIIAFEQTINVIRSAVLVKKGNHTARHAMHARIPSVNALTWRSASYAKEQITILKIVLKNTCTFAIYAKAKTTSPTTPPKNQNQIFMELSVQTATIKVILWKIAPQNQCGTLVLTNTHTDEASKLEKQDRR